MSDLVSLADLRTGPETVLRRVRHAVSDRRFVTKAVLAAADPRAADRVGARLKREADFAAAAARHDRFLPVLDWDAEARTLTYGDALQTLGQFVRGAGKLDPPLVASVLYQCVQALDHLHAQGYAHGWLTADGVFVTPDGDVALADFTGYKFRDREVPVRPEYTVWYRAPELIDVTLDQAIPERERLAGTPAAVRADLYSVGYLGVQLLRSEAEFVRLFGVAPQAGAADINWDQWHGDLTQPAPDLDKLLYDVPKGLRGVLQPLIQKAPADRTRLTAQGVLAAIDQLGLRDGRKLPVGGKPAPAPPPPVAPRRPVPPAIDRVVLKLTHPAGQSRVLPATQSVVIGRDQRCDVWLAELAASRHALLVHRGAAGWWAYDLGPKGQPCQTTVNGKSAAAGHPVRSNDVLRVGDVELRATVHRGFRFGPFLIAAQLHAGRNGTVYRAIWTERNNAEVALKVFPVQFQRDTEAVLRYLRSSQDAGPLRHRNVVSLYNGGFRKTTKRGRVWYLAMRYMPNGSLRDRLKTTGPLPPAEVARFGRDIAAALQAIGERGVVHRNINPACVLFDGDAERTARLSDFLLCRREELETYHKVTRPGDAVLTDYAYQAPEQLRGADVDWRADQYSLAACLYEALAGRPAVVTEGRALPDILAAIDGEAVPPPGSADPALDAVVLRAMSKSPADRFATPADLLAALAGH